jgi:holliday junction DNA helicase RuvB
MKGWIANMDILNNENGFKQHRITCLSHVRGQPQVVGQLETHLKAFWNSRFDDSGRPSTLGPIFLSGPPGTGKTLIAGVIHKELGNLKFIEKTGVVLNHKQDLYSMLINADEHTTLFIDEAQAMKADAQYILLTAISEHHICLPSGTASYINNIPLANFTLILATTDEYLLQDALRSRMKICCQFDFYSVDDLAILVRQRASTLGWQLQSDQIAVQIARRAKGIPRHALDRLLPACWSVAKSQSRDTINDEDAHLAFQQLQIDDAGLEKRDRAYLAILVEQNPSPLNILSAKLGLPPQTVQKVVEPYLIQCGFVTKVHSSYRMITPKGIEYMNQQASTDGFGKDKP